MDQKERRTYLLNYLLAENPQAGIGRIPDDEKEQKALLRGLMNIRMPQPVSSDFLTVQDAYLKEEISSDGIVEMADLVPLQPELYLWQGDITRLKCDAIVNAANSQMLGCFCPNHGCIDNAIHTFAGVELRSACAKLMEAQGHEEETGSAKITPAFNLPGRSFTDGLRKRIRSCLAPAIVPAWSWRRKMGQRVSLFAVFPQESFIFRTIRRRRSP